ncbi:hypothetical protein B0A50_07618 [Salinomyces thailandicus]|uniref:DUF4211 domain-containing protein n=1 Tax=Salinomyces thailandicus TaxID=706561 RepID=A0A4U0TNA8_9PEZI|nr:hypothetical protein B0A50_07618 [Salinomyces thailandica]
MPSKRKRQSRITFTPLPSSSPATRGYNKQIQDRAAAVGFDGSPKKRRRLQTIEGGEDTLDGVNNDLPTPAATMDQNGHVTSDEDESDDAEPVRPVRSSQRPVIVDSDDEDDEIMISSAPHWSNGEEDEMPNTHGKQPKDSPDSFVAAPSSDEDVTIVEKPKKSRRRTQPESEDEEEAESDVPVTPSGRKRSRQERSRQEQEELDEDLDFLGPSSDVEALNRTPQTTQSKQKAAKASALERLKRSRAKQPEPMLEEEEEEVLGYEDNEDYKDDDDEVEEISGPAFPTSSRQMFTADAEDDGFVESGEESGEDLGTLEGMPIQYTKYARYKAKDLFKFAVEWMVQKKLNPAFDISNEIYELTFRKLDDEARGLAGSKFTSAAWTPEFTIALRSRPEIAYEEFDRSEGENSLRDRCDACNRSGHPATFQLQFQGSPYHPQTLEDISAHDSDDSDDDADAVSSGASSNADSASADHPSHDHAGREVPAANTIYYVGKFCMANAQTAHALNHWRWHLYQWTIMWLTKSGYMSDEKVVQRERWKTKKRRKYANKVVDRMEQDGVVRELWREFRKSVDEAKGSKQGRFGTGGGDW